MSAHGKTSDAKPILIKADANAPVLKVTGPSAITIRAGTVFAGRTFAEETPLPIDTPLEPGGDYAAVVTDGALGCVRLVAAPNHDMIFAGFHFAPGGNAPAYAGGDTTPAINPHSLWDLNFRPVCPDPRGMVLVERPGARFWCDVYLLGVNHLRDGTSRLGAKIADGDSPPDNPAGKRFNGLDYDTAAAVMAHHGKGLLSAEEFFAAALGVTERTSRDGNPKITQLDAPRTSAWGVMQATGNMWVWGHDGHPVSPRASVFGGSWLDGGDAGSRDASLGYWPGVSYGGLGARGRGDHLQLA